MKFGCADVPRVCTKTATPQVGKYTDSISTYIRTSCYLTIHTSIRCVYVWLLYLICPWLMLSLKLCSALASKRQLEAWKNLLGHH